MRSFSTVFGRPGVLIRFASRVAKAKNVRRARTTSVFPLCLGGETIFVAGGQPACIAFALCYRRAITDGIEVAQLFHGTIWVAWKVARILSHQRRIFPLSNLVLTQPKIVRECN